MWECHINIVHLQRGGESGSRGIEGQQPAQWRTGRVSIPYWNFLQSPVIFLFFWLSDDHCSIEYCVRCYDCSACLSYRSIHMCMHPGKMGCNRNPGLGESSKRSIRRNMHNPYRQQETVIALPCSCSHLTGFLITLELTFISLYSIEGAKTPIFKQCVCPIEQRKLLSIRHRGWLVVD